MPEELCLEAFRELLRQLYIKQADTERLIRDVTARIDGQVADHANQERRCQPPPLSPEAEHNDASRYGGGSGAT